MTRARVLNVTPLQPDFLAGIEATVDQLPLLISNLSTLASTADEL